MNFTVHGGLALLALAFLMPGHFLPWETFQSQFIAALGAALVAFGSALQARRSGRSMRLPALALLSLATATVPWLQFAAGQVHFMSDALLPSVYLAGFALAIAAGAAWVGEDRARMEVALLAWLLAAAAISVAIALVQWLNLGWSAVWMAELPPGARPFANLGQPNQLATLLTLGLVAVVVLFERRRIGPVTAAILAGWLGSGLVMTQSRTGWLALAILAAACVVPFTRGQPKRLRLRHIGIAAVLFVAAALAWGPLNDALLIRTINPLAERLQAGPRTLIWQAMLDAVAHAPWLGYGWNQVSLAQQAVAADGVAIGRMIDSAHNVALDLALWGGAPLAVAWAAVVAVGLVRRAARAESVPSWAALTAVLLILVHAMLEYPLDHSYFLLPLGLFWGLTSRPVAASGRIPVWLHAAGVTVLSAATFNIAAEYLPVELANRNARMVAAGIGIDRAPGVVVPDVHWLDAPREFIRFMGTPARTQMTTQELDWMRRVAQRHAFPPAMLRFALAAGLNGRPDEAASTLRQLCSMHGPLRCDEAVAAWTDAQAMHPALKAVAPPSRR